jgi:PEP-CTERM motif
MKAPDPSTEIHAPCQIKGESSLEKRLASYGVMSLAIAAATAGGTQPAYANVLQPPLSTSATGSVFFSLGGRAETSSFNNADFGLIQVGSQAFLAAFPDRAFLAASTSSVRLPAPLQSGVLIGTTGQQGTGPGGLKFVTFQQTLASAGGAGFWIPGGPPQFLGLQFDINGNPHYGWAEIAVENDFNVTLLAFEGNLSSANTPITAGASVAAVPEPSSVLLLALGAAGLAAYHRKRKTVAH